MLNEPGSDAANRLWTAATTVIASQLVYPEARAALAAARRAGRIGARAHRACVDELDKKLYAQLQVIALGEPLALLAGEISDAYRLRALDAVHLASVMSAGVDSMVLVTWDQALAAAGARAGYRVAP